MTSEINQRKFSSQIEVTDLIAEAVQNASARRNQVLDAKKPLIAFSEEEARGIMGGQGAKLDYITAGIFPTYPTVIC